MLLLNLNHFLPHLQIIDSSSPLSPQSISRTTFSPYCIKWWMVHFWMRTEKIYPFSSLKLFFLDTNGHTHPHTLHSISFSFTIVEVVTVCLKWLKFWLILSSPSADRFQRLLRSDPPQLPPPPPPAAPAVSSRLKQTQADDSPMLQATILSFLGLILSPSFSLWRTCTPPYIPSYSKQLCPLDFSPFRDSIS